MCKRRKVEELTVSAGGLSVYDSPVNNATSHFLHNMLFLLGVSLVFIFFAERSFEIS